jgi:hypothetical protein
VDDGKRNRPAPATGVDEACKKNGFKTQKAALKQDSLNIKNTNLQYNVRALRARFIYALTPGLNLSLSL